MSIVRDWAESGVVVLTGHPAADPVLPPGDAATRARAITDELAAATPVRVDGAQLLAERAALRDSRRAGRTSVGGSCRLLPTADGWAAVSCARPDDADLLGALVGQTIDDDPWEPVAQWLRRHRGDELDERAALLGLPAHSVSQTVASVMPHGSGLRQADGMLVVDFSALWAGPLCAHLLGLAGARVVKVETPGRPDGARRGDATFYDLLHGGHESVVLDPSTATGRRALAQLVGAADVVIEGSRPRALHAFGLDAEAEAARGCSWISITAAGRSSERIGFGDDVAAAAGLVGRDHAGMPVFCGDAIADPLTGIMAARLALAEAPGALWDVSMAGVVASTLQVSAGPSAQVARADGALVIEHAAGLEPVSAPTPRRPLATAPSMGADTEPTLRSLGIPIP